MKFILTTLLLLTVVFSQAQNQSGGWTIEPFSDIGFIENKGRYDKLMDEQIEFFALSGEYRIFFSENAFVFQKRIDQSLIPEYSSFKIEFQGSNSAVRIVETGMKSHSSNFVRPEDPLLTVHAKAFDELTYESIYENIDMKLELPTAGGLKYTFIVHPGGNYRDIQMTYDGINFSESEGGTLKLTNEMHALIDAEPIALVNGKNIGSRYLLNDSTVGFEVGFYNLMEELIIDPWITDDLPTTIYTQGCFEISCDDDGNVTAIYNRAGSDEVYGFDPLGAVVWFWDSFNSADLDMDPSTGRSYVSDHFPPGFRVFDVDGDLGVSYLFDPEYQEDTWRVRFNSVQNNICFGDGSDFLGSQVTVLSIDLLDELEYDVFADANASDEDCALLEVDPSDGAIYFVPSGPSTGVDGVTGNHLYKLDPTDPSIVLWDVFTDHSFEKDDNFPPAFDRNGVNGVACGIEDIYTYDGTKLIRYDKMTGERLDSLDLGLTMFGQYGIDTDPCGDLYVGTVDGVLRFTHDLIPKPGYVVPSATRDLVIGNGKLYVCGVDYVMEIDIGFEGSDLFLASEPSYCITCNGSASVVTSSCLELTLEEISWSPSGSTEATAEGLCPGWHVVSTTWTDGDGGIVIQVDSIEVGTAELDLILEISIVDEFCEGICNGSVMIVPENGTAPYTFLLDAESNDIGVFENLCAGTYELTVTDAHGCEYIDIVEINSADGMGLAVFSLSDPSCYGFADGSITAETSDGLSDIEYEWIPENEIGGATFNNLGAGSYTVIAESEEGCRDTLIVVLNNPDSLYADLNIFNVPCFGDSTGSVKVDSVYNAQGDLENISYYWVPNYFGFEGAGIDSAWGMPIGDYTLTINDDNGCSKIYDFSLTEPPALVFSELGVEPAFCRLTNFQNGNGVVFAAATGGVSDYDYNWEYLDGIGSSSNSTWGGRNPGTYRITVTDNNGCKLIETVELDSVNPIAAFSVVSDQLDENCEGTELVIANFINESEFFADPKDPSADTTFFWNLDQGQAGWQISHSYFEEFDSSYVGEAIYEVCLVAINKNGCKDTTCKDLIVHVQPEFIAPNIFSPDADGLNDFFTFEFRTLGIETFYCQIINRWGVPVAELNSINEGWDGYDFNGNFCPDGTYFYNYAAIATNGTAFNGQGTVQLTTD